MNRSSQYSVTEVGMILYAVLCLISMATMSFGAALLILCLLFDRGGPRRLFREAQSFSKHPKVTPFLVVSLLLMVAFVFSLLSARFFPLSFGGQSVAVHWVRDLGKVWYFLFPILLGVGWDRLSFEQSNRVLRAWFITFGVFSAVGILQFFTGWPRSQPNPILPGYFHSTLGLGHHLSAASIWIFPFFAALDLSFRRKSALQSLGLSRFILILFWLLGLCTLILGFSRTLWAALPVGLGVWILGRFSRKKALPILGLLLVLGLASTQTSFFERRVYSKMGIGDRVELWKANLVFFKDRPIFGVGLGKNQELSRYYFQSIYPGQEIFVGHAHNIYLEVIAGLGLFGLCAWIVWNGWLLNTLRLAANLKNELSFSWGIFCAWIVFLINGLTQVNFFEGKVLHQVMWVIGMTLGWLRSSSRQDQKGELR